MEMLLPLKTETTQTPKIPELSADEMKKFVGKYEHAPQTWEFVIKDNKLFIKTGGKDFELKQTNKNEFEYEQGGVLFVPNASGEFEHIFMGLYAARKVS